LDAVIKTFLPFGVVRRSLALASDARVVAIRVSQIFWAVGWATCCPRVIAKCSRCVGKQAAHPTAF
jgi:hypothetical protein